MNSKIPGLRIRKRKKGFSYYFDVPKSHPRKLIPLGTDIYKALHTISEIEKKGFDFNSLKKFTFKDAKNQYFLSSNFQILAERTKKDYFLYIDQLLKVFSDAPLDEIKTTFLYQYLEFHSSRKVRANREMSLFSIIFNFARRVGLTEAINPAMRLQKHKETSRTRYITDFELKDFLKDSDPVFKLEIDMLYRTGLRFEDCRKVLKEEAISEVSKTTSKLRFIHSKEFKKTVDQLTAMHDKQTLFFHPEGTFRKLFYKQRELTGVVFTIHDLRAKAISDYAEIYGDIEAQKFASHNNIQTTIKYIRNRKGVKVNSL